jgi:hypothetical protein
VIKVSPTVKEASITATVIAVAMSKKPDTVSQFKNCLRIGQPFFEKDWLAVDATPIVRSAAFPERTRRETLLFVNDKTEELTKRSEQRRADRRQKDIISENRDGSVSLL